MSRPLGSRKFPALPQGREGRVLNWFPGHTPFSFLSHLHCRRLGLLSAAWGSNPASASPWLCDPGHVSLPICDHDQVISRVTEVTYVRCLACSSFLFSCIIVCVIMPWALAMGTCTRAEPVRQVGTACPLAPVLWEGRGAPSGLQEPRVWGGSQGRMPVTPGEQSAPPTLPLCSCPPAFQDPSLRSAVVNVT